MNGSHPVDEDRKDILGCRSSTPGIRAALKETVRSWVCLGLEVLGTVIRKDKRGHLGGSVSRATYAWFWLRS